MKALLLAAPALAARVEPTGVWLASTLKLKKNKLNGFGEVLHFLPDGRDCGDLRTTGAKGKSPGIQPFAGTWKMRGLVVLMPPGEGTPERARLVAKRAKGSMTFKDGAGKMKIKFQEVASKSWKALVPPSASPAVVPWCFQEGAECSPG